jgi:pantoate--beta-alanine ligase
MRIVTSIAAMQRLARQWRRRGARVGLVPTMGFLHDGHLSLIKRARQAVGPRGQVVVSIYVNPTQFAPGEDLGRYPRDFARDKLLCSGAGVDVIFAPGDRQMYPAGTAKAFSTFVVEESLSNSMEGASRPTHFRGVTTVVAKLFNIVQPDFAVFGAKDFQQAAIVKCMVRDLNFSLKILVAPTRREPDGLALSSRNKYLTGALRPQATVLSRAIQMARAAVSKSKSISAEELKSVVKELVEREPDAQLDYVEFFDPDTLIPVSRAGSGAHMALAVFIGKTRLIDNGEL